MTCHPLEKTLCKLADPGIAEKSKRFHKTEKANAEEKIQYFGIRMPTLRELAKENKNLALDELPDLLSSPNHESRLLAVLILVEKYSSAHDDEKTKIYRFYLNHTVYLNSWDLVDCSAYFIVGPYLEHKNRGPLYKLARSQSLWERRIAMLSTLHYIRNRDFSESLKLAEILLQDEEDLMRKVVGWMLKEVGKRDRDQEDAFLKKHYRKMPRTLLRYAIELYPEPERQAYLKGRI